MEKKLRLEIPLLLPHIRDDRDQCIDRLLERVSVHRDIGRVHIDRNDGSAVLCLHYDPSAVSLTQVDRWARQAGAEVRDRYKHETIRVTNMDCADCAARTERVVGKLKGVLSASVSFASERIHVEFDSTVVTREVVTDRVRALGYKVEEAPRPRGWIPDHLDLISALASGACLGAGFAAEHASSAPWGVALALYLAAYVAGGIDALRRGVKAAIHLSLDIDFLMVLAAIGAAILGEWAEGALLLFLFSLGHSLEGLALGKARKAIRALGEITPKTARVLRDGAETEMPVDELRRGDRVLVRAGERVPIDGSVVSGRSAVDQSPITGESVPVEKGEGDQVFAGTVNGEGALQVEVTRLAQDTTLARVIQMVEEAQARKSPTQRFTEKFERIFVPVVLAAVVLMIVLPPIVGLLSFSQSFLRGLTMLVAASPCALAISTPAAVLSGIAQAARNGVLIKGGVHLEHLGQVDALAFDKTGTITVGRPEIKQVIPLEGTERSELLRVAGAICSRSAHPISKALTQFVESEGIRLPQAGEVQTLSGLGLEGALDGGKVTVGSSRLFSDGSATLALDVVAQVEALEAQGMTTILVGDGQRVLGIIALADSPRPDAAAMLESLRSLGIRKTIMLTGDNERVAAAIAREVDLTDFRAELLPEDKARAIEALRREHGQVAMVGDGVNDAPALAHSTVGIAMGGAGTDVALETADVALMADDLSKLPFAVALSRFARQIIVQNVFISLGVIAALVPMAMLGAVSIAPAVALHEGSTLVVVINALRLLRFRYDARVIRLLTGSRRGNVREAAAVTAQ